MRKPNWKFVKSGYQKPYITSTLSNFDYMKWKTNLMIPEIFTPGLWTWKTIQCKDGKIVKWSIQYVQLGYKEIYSGFILYR